MNSNIKVCVIGATGFIGSSITKELAKRGIKWKGVSRSSNSNPLIEKAITKDELVQVFNDYPYVINASGALKPKDFEDNPTLSFQALQNSVDTISGAIEESKLQKFIHISSAGTIYGEGVDNHSFSEDAPLIPISFYGKAKMQEEKNYELITNKYNCQYVSARVSNPYGNNEKTTHGFIDVLINSIRENTKFSYYNDIDPSRDFIYANDMSEMIVNLACNEITGVFNVCSGKSFKISEIIDFVKEYSKSENLSATRSSNEYEVKNNNISAEKMKSMGLYINTIDIFEYIRKKLNK